MKLINGFLEWLRRNRPDGMDLLKNHRLPNGKARDVHQPLINWQELLNETDDTKDSAPSLKAEDE